MSYIFVFGRFYEEEKLFGGEKFTKRLYKYLPDNNEYKIVFIDFFFGYEIKNVFRKLFGEIVLDKQGNKSFVRLGIVKILIKLLKHKPDRIFITTFEGYSILSFLNFNRKATVFYLVNGVYKYEISREDRNRASSFIRLKAIISEKIIFKHAQVFFFLSNHSVQLAKNYYKIPPEKGCILMNHGVDDFFFQSRHEYNQSDTLRIIYTGGINRNIKGFDFLVRSLSDIKIRLNLFICGKVENEYKLLSGLKKIPDTICVNVLGYLESHELAEYFRSCDIFLLPSEFETFSISTIEAMASSLVPIVTIQAGVSRYILNKQNGFLISFNDNESIASILNLLNNDRKLLAEVGQTAYLSVKELKWENIINKYFEILADK